MGRARLSRRRGPSIVRGGEKEGSMRVNKIDHICIAVRDLDAARAIWEPILGKTGPDDPYDDPIEKVRVARYWVGEVGFELIASTEPGSDVDRFIQKRGEGVMLLGLNVDDTRAALGELGEPGYPTIGGARPFRDCEFGFVHPKGANGVLLELIDYRWPESNGDMRLVGTPAVPAEATEGPSE
jgi:methylmalonyl-CoA/ethylmalonyl-CoA epimerase